MAKQSSEKMLTGKDLVSEVASVVSGVSDQKSSRIIIENVRPRVDAGLFPVRRVVDEPVDVLADVFTDGHDDILVFLLYREKATSAWTAERMKFMYNDLWAARFTVVKATDYVYTVRGYLSAFTTWRADLKKKVLANQNVAVDLKIGAGLMNETASRCPSFLAEKLTAWAKVLLDPKDMAAAVEVALADELLMIMENNLDEAKSVTFAPEILVTVDRKQALFSAWYEFFPRSWSLKAGEHGTFLDGIRILPEIARMGFDVVYLPPIHPIGKTHRKGKNNAVVCGPDEPGCPWAIGGVEGGHKALHPELGTMDDFKLFIQKAKEFQIEVAIDVAFQCSPDHPYVKAHPSWFNWRPDGTVQYAENPPKKYEDVLPFNFATTDRQGLWEELKSVFIFWAGHGVRIFRVDNPHTKPFLFWDWLITEVKKEYPDALFLAEAFTRPKIMYRLAKGGFTQSYTYFTWRNTKKEFEEYLTELAQTDVAEFFHPNFWPNTPDILPEHLQKGNRASFMMRAALAATMSSNWGIYGPAFELCLTEPYPGKEEYNDNEKYEIKHWQWDKPGNIKDFIANLNKIRRGNPALQMTRNIRFGKVENDHILAYYKVTEDHSNVVVIFVNLDPHQTQSGWFQVPCAELGLDKDRAHPVEELLSGERSSWHGERIFIQLDPAHSPAQIFKVSR